MSLLCNTLWLYHIMFCCIVMYAQSLNQQEGTFANRFWCLFVFIISYRNTGRVMVSWVYVYFTCRSEVASQRSSRRARSLALLRSASAIRTAPCWERSGTFRRITARHMIGSWAGCTKVALDSLMPRRQLPTHNCSEWLCSNKVKQMYQFCLCKWM